MMPTKNEIQAGKTDSVDINSRMNLVYLKYWTLNLRPLIYPNVLHLRILCPGTDSCAVQAAEGWQGTSSQSCY